VAPRVDGVSTLADQSGRWTIRAIRLNGHEVTDTGVEVKANEDLSDLEVELTTRSTTVAGTVTNARGDLVTDYWTVGVRAGSGTMDPSFPFPGHGAPRPEWPVHDHRFCRPAATTSSPSTRWTLARRPIPNFSTCTQ